MQNGHDHYSMNRGEAHNPIYGSFFFKKKIERIDWRRLGGVDLERVIQQLDFKALQDNLISVAFCDIESEVDTRCTDPNFVKLFKLSQLIIEYLLHSQEYLTNAVASLEQKYQDTIQGHDIMQSKLMEKQKEFTALRIECHRRKKLLLAQQQIMDSGPGSYQRCHLCDKAFLNATYLANHVARRHGDGPPTMQSHHSEVTRISTTEKHAMSRSLELELRELVNRLKTSEGQGDLHKDDVDLSSLHAWKDDLMRQHKAELEQMRALFMQESKELHDRNRSLERSLKEMATKFSQAPRSHIGEIEDDSEGTSKRKSKKTPPSNRDEERRMLEAEMARQKALKRMAEPVKILDNENITVKRHLGQNRSVTIQPPPQPEYVDDEDSDSQRNVTAAMGRALREAAGDYGSNASIDASLLRSSRLMDQLRADPDVLRALKADLEQLLEENLAERGVRPGTTRITNPFLNDKLGILRNERLQLSKKHINFAAIRQALVKKLEKTAREKLRGQYDSSDRRLVNPSNSLPRMNSASRDVVLRSPAKSPTSAGAKPQPNRSLSFESYSDDDDYEETKPRLNSGYRHSSPARTGAVPSPRKRRQHSSPNVSPHDGVDHTDGPRAENHRSPEHRQPTREIEQIVEDLDFIDHLDLVSPKANPKITDKRITGGVQVLPSNPFPKSTGHDDESDDEDLVTPMMEEEDDIDSDPGNHVHLSPPKIVMTTGPMGGSSDMSNTLGTSQWGTVSKMASTANPGATNKSSEMGMEDYDSDFN